MSRDHIDYTTGDRKDFSYSHLELDRVFVLGLCLAGTRRKERHERFKFAVTSCAKVKHQIASSQAHLDNR